MTRPKKTTAASEGQPLAAGSYVDASMLAALIAVVGRSLGKRPEELTEDDVRRVSVAGAVGQGMARSANWRLYVRSRDKNKPDPKLYMTDGADVDETTHFRQSQRVEAEAVMASRRAEVELESVGVIMPARVTLKTILAHYRTAKKPVPGDTEEAFSTYHSKLGQLEDCLRHYPGTHVVHVCKKNNDLYSETVQKQLGPRYEKGARAETPCDGADAGEAKPRTRKHRSRGVARAHLKVLDEAIAFYREEKGMMFKPVMGLGPAYKPRLAWFHKNELVALLKAARGCMHDTRTGTWMTTRVWADGETLEDGSYRGPRDLRYSKRTRSWRYVQLDRPSMVTRFKVDHAAKARWKGVCRMIVLGYRTGTRHMTILRMRWKRDNVSGYFSIPPQPEIGEPRVRGAFRRHDLGAKVTNKNVNARQLTPTPFKLQALARCWRNADERTGATWVVTQPNGLPYRNHVTHFAKIAERAGLEQLETRFLEPAIEPDDDGPMDAVFHLTRHTCVQRLYENGVSIWAAAVYVGTGVTNLQRTYVGWTILGMTEAVDAIDRDVPVEERFLHAA